VVVPTWAWFACHIRDPPEIGRHNRAHRRAASWAATEIGRRRLRRRAREDARQFNGRMPHPAGGSHALPCRARRSAEPDSARRLEIMCPDAASETLGLCRPCGSETPARQGDLRERRHNPEVGTIGVLFSGFAVSTTSLLWAVAARHGHVLWSRCLLREHRDCPSVAALVPMHVRAGTRHEDMSTTSEPRNRNALGAAIKRTPIEPTSAQRRIGRGRPIAWRVGSASLCVRNRAVDSRPVRSGALGRHHRVSQPPTPV
jgi:hypothetical protein